MDLDYLPFCERPSKPQFQLPAGAVDAHCHVFGPAAEFPFAEKRKYTPCDAGKLQLFGLRDFLGFSQNVIVQASCHGSDNRALLDALNHSAGQARGVAVVDASINEAELHTLHQAGVRGVRFNFVRRLVDILPFDKLHAISEKIKPLGWHIVVYFEAADLAELTPFLTELQQKHIVVIDHMGRPDVGLGVEHPQFQQFMQLLHDCPNIWSKVTCPERLTEQSPKLGERAHYADVIPFARTLVEQFPGRVLWGTDWPHPNMKSHMPDDGHLVDIIPQIAPTSQLQQALLVDNPNRLYWSD